MMHFVKTNVCEQMKIDGVMLKLKITFSLNNVLRLKKLTFFSNEAKDLCKKIDYLATALRDSSKKHMKAIIKKLSKHWEKNNKILTEVFIRNFINQIQLN